MSNQEILPSLFNRKITIKRSVATVDNAAGSSTFSETITYDNVWAYVDGLSTGRKQYLGVDLFTSAYDIQMRKGADILTSDLIYYENSTFSIVSVQLVRQSFKMFYVLVVKEVSSQG